MKQVLHKMTALFMILSLLVTAGCTKNNDYSHKGGYVEEQVQLSSDVMNIFGIFESEEGGIELYVTKSGDDNNPLSYHVQAEGTLSQQNISWYDAFRQIDCGYIFAMDRDTNDNIYIIYANGTTSELNMAVFHQDQLVRNVVLDMQNADMKTVSQMQVIDDEKVLVGDGYESIQCFNTETGDAIGSYGETSCGDFVAVQDKIYELNYQLSQIECYDLSTGAIENTIKCENLDNTSKLLRAEDGFYLITKAGIFHLNENGSLWECILEEAGNYLGLPLYTIERAKLVNGEFYIVFKQGLEECVLQKYKYSEDYIPSAEKEEIVAYMLEENPTLKQSLVQYQISHPNIKITTRIGVEGEEGISKSDAIRQLNTELMTGNGPDLILLDGLPIKTYIENGFLTDINACLTIDDKDYIDSHIVKTYSSNEGTYAIVSKFIVPLLWGNEAFLNSVNTLDDLVAYKEKNGEQVVLPYMSEDKLIKQFYGVFEEECLGENGEIKKEETVKFLNNIKALTQIEEAPHQDEVVPIFGFDMPDMAHVLAGDIQGCFVNPLTVKALIIQSLSGDTSGCHFKNLKVGKENIYKPHCILGINAKSEHKEEAADIIKQTLGLKIQSLDLEDGFPVNKEGFESYMQGINVDKSKESTYMYADKYGFATSWQNTKAITDFKKICSGLNESYEIDEALLEIVLTEIKPYFEDKESAEEVVSHLATVVDVYLKE